MGSDNKSEPILILFVMNFRFYKMTHEFTKSGYKIALEDSSGKLHYILADMLEKPA